MALSLQHKQGGWNCNLVYPQIPVHLLTVNVTINGNDLACTKSTKFDTKHRKKLRQDCNNILSPRSTIQEKAGFTTPGTVAREIADPEIHVRN